MRLLILTHTFPPSRHPNAKRPFYLARACLQAGWQVDVVTTAAATDTGSAEALCGPGLRVLRFKNPFEQFRQKFAGNYPLFRFASLVGGAFLWPDESVLWSLKALRAAGQIRADRTVAFILPASLLLAGMFRRLAGPSWVFDYQESVTPQLELHPRRSPVRRLLQPALRNLERRTLHRAGRVVFTANTNRLAYIRAGLVEEANTVHIPYFFDAAAFCKPDTTRPDKFRIAYFGTFDWRGQRSPEHFLRALARFLERRPEARPQTEFAFRGAWLSEHDRFVRELNLKDVVSIQPSVDYEDYIQKLREAAALLLVVSSAHNLFMPSKIVDYFGARRPILAFVPRDSELRHILDQAGMSDFACDEGDVPAAVAALERLWERFQKGALTCTDSQTDFWSSEVQIPRYLEILGSKK